MTLPSNKQRAELRLLRRDELQEIDWLRSAELDAGRSGFAKQALDRLAAGQELYGNRWASAGVARLTAELSEEAADIGAWGVLALQALEHDPALHRGDRELVESALHAAILWGAYAHHALALAVGHLAPLPVEGDDCEAAPERHASETGEPA